MIHRLFILVCLTFGSGIGAYAEETARDIDKGPLESRVNALASIQPGLGVVMHEMGYRFADAYWAANGGNWGLAQYELKELLEAQKVAEITAAVTACNACHTAQGYGFIRYHVQKQRKQELLDFTVKTEPKYDEAKEPK